MTDITGYKPLNDEQKSHMNAIKQKESEFLSLLKAFLEPEPALSYTLDKRWLMIARTHIEEASMAACRAVTSPSTVEFK
jgi:hypothetical protein